MRIKNELISRLQSQVESNCKDLKLFNSIIRLPIMCAQFQKALKLKVSSDQFKKFEQASIQYLRQHINPENEAEFFDDFTTRMDDNPFSKVLETQHQM